jgi:hypothetical protein
LGEEIKTKDEFNGRDPVRGLSFNFYCLVKFILLKIKNKTDKNIIEIITPF